DLLEMLVTQHVFIRGGSLSPQIDQENEAHENRTKNKEKMESTFVFSYPGRILCVFLFRVGLCGELHKWRLLGLCCTEAKPSPKISRRQLGSLASKRQADNKNHAQWSDSLLRHTH